MAGGGRRLDISQELNFSNGKFLSDSVNLGNSGTLEGVLTSSGFRLSDIEFRVSVDNITFVEAKDADNNTFGIIDLNAGEYRALRGDITKGVKFLKAERDNITGNESITVIIAYDE